jgi:hypothetical protein
MKKTAVIGLSLIAIMFFSSIAFAVIQSVPRSGQESTETLPSSRILTQALTAQQEVLIVQNDFTLMRYFYPSACSECGERMSLLEAFATTSEFSDQLFLVELSGEENERLEFVSKIGSATLQGAEIDINNTADVLCEITTRPPVGCTFRNIQ